MARAGFEKFCEKLPPPTFADQLPPFEVLEIPPTKAPLRVTGVGEDELQRKMSGPASTVIDDIMFNSTISLWLVQSSGLVI